MDPKEELAVDIGCLLATMLDYEKEFGPAGLEEAAVFLVLDCSLFRYAIVKRVILHMKMATLDNGQYSLTDEGRKAGKIVNDELERLKNKAKNN